MFLCPSQTRDSPRVTALSMSVFNFAHSSQSMVTMQEQNPNYGLTGTLFDEWRKT